MASVQGYAGKPVHRSASPMLPFPIQGMEKKLPMPYALRPKRRGGYPSLRHLRDGVSRRFQ